MLGAQSKDRAERLHSITCRPERHSRLRNAVLARRELAAALAPALERAWLRAAARAHDRPAGALERAWLRAVARAHDRPAGALESAWLRAAERAHDRLPGVAHGSPRAAADDRRPPEAAHDAPPAGSRDRLNPAAADSGSRERRALRLGNDLEAATPAEALH
jgi:hypothetical protein